MATGCQGIHTKMVYGPARTHSMHNGAAVATTTTGKYIHYQLYYLLVTHLSGVLISATTVAELQ